MVGEARRHRWRAGPPLLRGARAVGGLRLWQGLAYARVGQTEIVVDMVQHEVVYLKPADNSDRSKTG